MKSIGILFSFFFVCASIAAQGQVINKLGLRAGAGIANQYWKNTAASDMSAWKSDDMKAALFVVGEKNISQKISLRPELGYIQKGFKNNILFTEEDGSRSDMRRNNVLLHKLSAGLDVRIDLFKPERSPYLIIGLRSDYLLDYVDAEVEVQGDPFPIYTDQLKDFNPLSLGGVIGLGLELENSVFLDVEWNPSFTNNLQNESYRIRDTYFGLTAGFFLKNK